MPFNLLGIAYTSPAVADAAGRHLSEAPENRRTRRPKDRTVAATASNQSDVDDERCVRVANVFGRCASTSSLRTVAHANCPLGGHGAGFIASACSARALRGVNDCRARSSPRRYACENPSPSASRLGIPILRRAGPGGTRPSRSWATHTRAFANLVLKHLVVTSVDRENFADARQRRRRSRPMRPADLVREAWESGGRHPLGQARYDRARFQQVPFARRRELK